MVRRSVILFLFAGSYDPLYLYIRVIYLLLAMTDGNQDEIEIINEKVVAGERYVTLDVGGTEINVRGKEVQIAEVDFER